MINVWKTIGILWLSGEYFEAKSAEATFWPHKSQAEAGDIFLNI